MAHSGRYITSYSLAGQARGSATKSCHASEASRIEAMAIVHCGVIYDSGDGWKQTSAVVGMPRLGTLETHQSGGRPLKR
jgi:hypothetical protein